MPFTVSHIAAVLPGYRVLSRRHLFTAAVIGSMVPDFGFLLPVSPGRMQTHSLTGLFMFSLPVGLLAYWLTLVLIKPALIEVLPSGPYTRLLETEARMPRPSLAGWLLAALVILGAAALHMIWDGFTHENAAGVRMFPVLDDLAPEIDGHSLQFFRWLQYGSSVLGLSVVIMALVLWLCHVPHPPRRPPRRLGAVERGSWISLYFLLPLLTIAVVLWHLHADGNPTPLGRGLELIAVAGMRSSILALLLLSLMLRVRLANLFQRRMGA